MFGTGHSFYKGSMRFLSKLEVCASKVIRQRSKIFWRCFLMFFFVNLCAIVTQPVSGIASCVGFVGARRPELTVFRGDAENFLEEREFYVWDGCQ